MVSHNPITGDKLITKQNTKEYEDNFDPIFGPRKGREKGNINEAMKDIPKYARYKWCEEKACLCVGCVNVSGALIAKGFTKEDWQEWMEGMSKNIQETKTKLMEAARSHSLDYSGDELIEGISPDNTHECLVDDNTKSEIAPNEDIR